VHFNTNSITRSDKSFIPWFPGRPLVKLKLNYSQQYGIVFSCRKIF
jgi:hypothetical protein